MDEMLLGGGYRSTEKVGVSDVKERESVPLRSRRRV
jgi:hypothetical protein